MLSIPTHPLESVTVTIYSVVTEGLAIGFGKVLLSNVAAEVQLKLEFIGPVGFPPMVRETP